MIIFWMCLVKYNLFIKFISPVYTFKNVATRNLKITHVHVIFLLGSTILEGQLCYSSVQFLPKVRCYLFYLVLNCSSNPYADNSKVCLLNSGTSLSCLSPVREMVRKLIEPP